MGQRLNFKGVAALLIERNHYYRMLVAQILRGFGLDALASCETGAAAKDAINASHIDFCVMEADLVDMPGADFITWIRREQKEPVRFMPVLVLSGYTQRRLVSVSRDAGANLLLNKPVSAKAIFDRLAWLARTPRSYIETRLYVGPDRRFKESVPPDQTYKRESDANKPDTAEQAVTVIV